MPGGGDRDEPAVRNLLGVQLTVGPTRVGDDRGEVVAWLGAVQAQDATLYTVTYVEVGPALANQAVERAWALNWW